MASDISAQSRLGGNAAAGTYESGGERKTPAHDAGVCECNAVAWDLAIDETRTIRRYRVWQCRFCKRLREREDPA